jgi:signal transduction histidine kinase
MISALTVSLDRFCRFTAEVLGCEVSHAWVWQTDEAAYVPVASHGLTTEEGDTVRRSKVPLAPLAPLLAHLKREDVVQAVLNKLPEAARPLLCGAARALCIAIRQDAQIIALIIAGLRASGRRFSPKQVRTAGGLAQLAVALTEEQPAERVEPASYLKSELISTMSHELRAPLGVIMGYNDLLLEGAFGSLNTEQSEILRRIEKSVREALDLVSNTLNLSRFEAGRLPLDLEEVGLADLIRELDAETREFQHKPGVSFLWTVPVDLPRLYTDPVKLKVVLKNLIINAVKFTEQGSVTFAVGPRQGEVEFSVTDTGIGMAPEEVPFIFERFRQLDSAAFHRRGGVGLGLFIARRLVEMLGGHIMVETELGRGSTFRVWVPITHPRRETSRRRAGAG